MLHANWTPKSEIYALAFDQGGLGYGQPEHRYFYVQVSIHQPDCNMVHYCRMRFSAVTYLNGVPFDNDAENKRGRSIKAWEQIARWLFENEYHYQEGIVAMHKDLTLFNGHMRSLYYDKENDRFILRESGEDN